MMKKFTLCLSIALIGLFAYAVGSQKNSVGNETTVNTSYSEQDNEKAARIAATSSEDVTDLYITNARFLNGDAGWTCSFAPGKANNGHIGALEAYAGWGSLELASFSMTQKIKLPSGQYRLTSNAFYRYGLNFDTDASRSEGYMVCGTDRTLLPTLGSIAGLSSYANSMDEALAAFENGLYETSTDFKILNDDTEIEVGYSGVFPIKQSWFISGPLTLERIGDVSIQGYIDDINTALASVPATGMEKTYKDALDEAVANAQAILTSYEADATSVTATAANDACEALKQAIIDAEPSVKIYASIMAEMDKAQSLDATGQAKFNELAADIKKAYEDGTITDGTAELQAIAEMLIEATTAQTASGSDWSVLGSTAQADWKGASGVYQSGVERYNGDNTPYNAGIILSQTIKNLIPGAEYQVTFYAVANVARNLSAENYGAGIAYLFANDTEEDIDVLNQAACTILSSDYLRTLNAYAAPDGTIEFGIANRKAGGQWYVAQFVSLKLVKLPADPSLSVPGTTSLLVGDSKDLTALVSSSSDGEITYTSSDESIATVTDGVLVGVSKGTAEIVVSQTSSNGYAAAEAKIAVTVNVLPELPAIDEDAYYYWQSPEGTVEEAGGKAVASEADPARVNYPQTVQFTQYYTISLNGKKDLSDDKYTTVTLDKALSEGDTIIIYAFKNKGDASKKSGVKFFWGAEGTGSTMACGDDFQDMGLEGNELLCATYAVPASAAGNTVFRMSRSETGTNLFIVQLSIVPADIPTGIVNVNANGSKLNGQAIYNLRGQKVTKLNAGEIYISGGKKFIIK